MDDSEWESILPKTPNLLIDFSNPNWKERVPVLPTEILDEIKRIYQSHKSQKEANGGQNSLLWPQNPRHVKLKNEIGQYLVDQYQLEEYNYDEEQSYVKSGSYDIDKKKAIKERSALLEEQEKKENIENEVEELFLAAEAGNSKAFDELISHLGNSIVHRLVIDKLEKLGNASAFEPLKKVFKEGGEESDSAARALASINPDKAFDLMKKSLKSTKTRKSAACGLGWLGRKECVDNLCQYLNTKDWETLIKIISTLGEIGDKRAVGPLEDRLKACFKYKKQFFWCKVAEGNVNIRFYTVSALEELNDPSCVSTLAEVLECEMDALTHWAGSFSGEMIDSLLGAIMHFADRIDSDNIDNVAYSVIKIFNETEVNVRIHWDERIMYAANALGKLGSKNALPHLERRLKEFEAGDFENPDYRVFTIQARPTPSTELPEWLLDAVRTAINEIKKQ